MNRMKKLSEANSRSRGFALDDVGDAGGDQQADEHPQERLAQERGLQAGIGLDAELAGDAYGASVPPGSSA